MSQAARVTSIEVLREFKTALVLFCEEARDCLSGVDMTMRRMEDWLLRDQLSNWKRIIRDRDDDLTQAKADLFRKQLSKISGDNPDLMEEKKAVRRAQERLREAQEKAQRCQEWGRELPRAHQEFKGPGRRLEARVEGEPPQIVIMLERILASLDAYVDVAVPSSLSTGIASATTERSAGSMTNPVAEAPIAEAATEAPVTEAAEEPGEPTA